jgi:hypothetical protein
MKDPIVAEIHKHREEHARRSNYDLDAICEDLRAMHLEKGLNVVRLPPKRLPKREETPRKCS